MRPCLVEVHDIRIQDPLELLLLKDQQVVQAFLPYAPHEAFADGIGAWRMIWGFEYLDAASCRHTSKARSKFGIVIPNQVLWRLSIGRGFSELLGRPCIRRRACHADMDHLTRLQFDDEECKERPKEQVSHLQEVTCPDLSGVVAQKGRPPLASWLLCANSSHVCLNGSLADAMAQLQEFSPNPFSAPESVVRRHFSDQGNRFLGDLGLARSGL